MLRPYITPCAPLPPWHDRRLRVGIRRGELGRPIWAELRRHVPELQLVTGGAEVPRLEPADCEGMLGAPGLGRMPDLAEFHGVNASCAAAIRPSSSVRSTRSAPTVR